MWKACSIALCLLVLPVAIFSQCLTAPPPPTTCTGSEPLLTDNETLLSGTDKWYYGSPVTMNSMTLKGGTLVVCSDLTIDKFYMERGKIIILPGARLVIGSGLGSGIVLRGDCAIYNYGVCEIQRNLSLDNGYATASTPNLVINATSSSIFKMSSQYLVVNNSYSWFVNNGTAEFWGIVTDTQASGNSVCLGNGSITEMAVLINKVANSYQVSGGTACLTVRQFSQFFSPLAASPGLHVCLAPGHSSDAGCIPFGCQPNNWGAAQVFTNCEGCNMITALPVNFSSFTASKLDNNNTRLEWEINTIVKGAIFKIERSGDGSSYASIDSLTVKDEDVSLFASIDKNPLKGTNYYMISYTNPLTRTITRSRIIQTTADNSTGISIYPIPFNNRIFIRSSNDIEGQKIMITDINGNNIHTTEVIRERGRLVELKIPVNIQPAIYIIHIRTDKSILSRTILKV